MKKTAGEQASACAEPTAHQTTANKVTYGLRRSKSGIWSIHWAENRRSKRLSTREKELEAAKAFLAKWLKIELSGAPTCADLWALYWEQHVLVKCASSEAHFYAWKKLEKRFGNLRPIEVTRDVIAEHRKARAPAKSFVELRLLHASWNFGVRRRAINPNDLPIIENLDLPPHPQRRERWLREDEVRRLFVAAENLRDGPRLSRVERFMWIALETAARRDAILYLQWEQVDLETRVIHLNPEGRAQTSKRRADVPISDVLFRVLLRAKSEKINEYVIDRPNRLHEKLDQVAAAAEVSGVTAHVFRHTAATWMARKGAPLWKIAKVLGNTVEEVERTYAKHCPDDLRDSVNLIGGSVFGAQ